MYNTQKNSSDPSAKTKFRLFKKLVEKEAKKKRIDYINNQVIDSLNKGNTKPFFRYVKSLKNDSVGLAPLKSGPDLVTDPQKKQNFYWRSSVVYSHMKTQIQFHG